MSQWSARGNCAKISGCLGRWKGCKTSKRNNSAPSSAWWSEAGKCRSMFYFCPRAIRLWKMLCNYYNSKWRILLKPLGERPLIGFVSPVMHPKNSNNYSKILEGVSASIDSFRNQTCTHFHAVFVFNEVPFNNPDPEKFTFLKVHSKERDPILPIRTSVYLDKALKIVNGLRILKQKNVNI